MSPLETIFIVGVAIAAISIGMLMLDDLFEGRDRRRRRAVFAAFLREVTVSDPTRRSALPRRRDRSAYRQPSATGGDGR